MSTRRFQEPGSTDTFRLILNGNPIPNTSNPEESLLSLDYTGTFHDSNLLFEGSFTVAFNTGELQEESTDPLIIPTSVEADRLFLAEVTRTAILERFADHFDATRLEDAVVIGWVDGTEEKKILT